MVKMKKVILFFFSLKKKKGEEEEEVWYLYILEKLGRCMISS
jgi:hypothetical protein